MIIARFRTGIVIYRSIGTKDDGSKRVRFPLQAEVHVKILAPVIGQVTLLLQCISGTQYILRENVRLHIVIGEPVANISAQFEVRGKLFAKVTPRVGRGRYPVVAPAKHPAPSTAAPHAPEHRGSQVRK